MIPLYFLGDGELDAVTLPYLVEKIIGKEVISEFKSWKKIRVHSMEGRKLNFAVLEAKNGNFSGFVAVIDKDKDSKGIRFKDLEEGKKKVLAKVMLPISIGEAIPHGEAWLLDEEKAVRDVLYLDGNTEVPGTKVSKNPKETLTELYQESRRASEDRTVVWEDIAKAVDLTKYSRPKETGFARFEKEVKDEIKRAIEK